MAVDKNVTILTVKTELNKCQRDAERYGWEISTLDESLLLFKVKMVSPLDKEIFLVSFNCDNYKEWPLYIDFIDPVSGQEGIKNAYPLNTDGFFHGNPLICNPCSRKAYKEFKGPHGDWKLTAWEDNPKTTTLKNIQAILLAVYGRISGSKYKGRMS